MQINDTQRKIYEFLVERSTDGVPPSVREIGAAVGLRSTSSVQSNLDALEAAGYIQRDPLLKRSIRIMGQADNVTQVPILGTVTAGAPILAVEQIESYIQDAIRSSVPRLTLDEAFEKKDDIAHDVQSSIAEGMLSYGFIITSTLVVNIAPDESVMNAMNAINAAQRNRAAAQELAEADRIKLVTAAKAKAEAAKLEGEGLADQRSAITEGLGANMSELQAKGISNDQVMQLLLLTQYMNTVESIGTQAGNSTIFLPGGADSMNQLSTQLMSSLQANELTNRQRTAKPVPFNDRNHNGVPDELERNIPHNPLTR